MHWYNGKPTDFSEKGLAKALKENAPCITDFGLKKSFGDAVVRAEIDKYKTKFDANVNMVDKSGLVPIKFAEHFIDEKLMSPKKGSPVLVHLNRFTGWSATFTISYGTVVYLMANRESVKVNFLAHVKQNMINATFGICADRYKATEKQKEQIKEKKAEVLNALRKCETIDDMISCEAAKPFISSSWLDTPESMIVRKMLNNATRKYPKNYDTMANKAFIEMDEIYQNSRAEIAENENSQPFEVVADVEAKEEPSFVTEG